MIDAGPVRRFPALDPEPPPPTPRERLVRLGAVLGVTALVVAGAVLAPRLGGDEAPAATRPAPATVADGRILVLDGRHLSWARPDGTLDRLLTTDAELEPLLADLELAPDGRRALLGAGPGLAGAGLLVDLTAAAPAAPVPAVAADLLAGATPAEQPWADGGRSVVLTRGPRADAVELVDASGGVRRLGAGVAAAADPTGPGAAVAAGGAPLLPDPEFGLPLNSAARVELRTAGRPPVVLLTAEDFLRAVGLPPGPLVVDRLTFSPDGSRLLVSGYPASQRGTDEVSAGLVVVDRTGTQLAAVPARPGVQGNWARWSPDGSTLALGTFVATATINDPDRTIELWDLQEPPVRVELPGALRGVVQEPCVWSPTEPLLMCGDDRGWYQVDTPSRTARAITPVVGRPVAWVAS